jgi:hypothetical protein
LAIGVLFHVFGIGRTAHERAIEQHELENGEPVARVFFVERVLERALELPQLATLHHD